MAENDAVISALSTTADITRPDSSALPVSVSHPSSVNAAAEVVQPSDVQQSQESRARSSRKRAFGNISDTGASASTVDTSASSVLPAVSSTGQAPGKNDEKEEGTAAEAAGDMQVLQAVAEGAQHALVKLGSACCSSGRGSPSRSIGSAARSILAAVHGGRLGEEYKMVLVLRMDVGMGKGKLVAQGAHAALGAYKVALKGSGGSGSGNEWGAWLSAWEGSGCAKIALKAEAGSDEKALLALARQAREAGLPYYTVRDAGHTQVQAGTLTCMAIGPGPAGKIDHVTGGLKLL